MQTIDKDTNPWSGALDSHNSEQDNYGSEPESQTLSSRIAPPQSSATPDTNESPRLTVQVPREREGPVDPHVASLRAMFPDFDDTVLQYVLESVQGDQDRAIDTLLGMSDPDYISSAQPQTPPVSSQTDLDEQLARRLMLEEEQEQHANWQAQQQHQQRVPRRESLPYEARVHQQPYGGNPPGGEKDTMAEIQEQFGKIAESGKKTIGTLISKVKAKMQEFDQPKGAQGSSTGTEPRWGASGGNSYQYESQQSFYNPNPPPSPPVQHQEYHTTSYQTYQHAPPSTHTQPSSHPSPTIEPTAGRGISTLTAQDTTRADAGNASASIDPSKLGLLPKRPVSLLRAQSPPQTVTEAHNDDDDDDDLEYAENPFEEEHKKL